MTLEEFIHVTFVDLTPSVVEVKSFVCAGILKNTFLKDQVKDKGRDESKTN